MDPIALVAVTLQVLSPFFKKAGDKFAEKIGEYVWGWIKKSFSGKKEPKCPSPDGAGEEELKATLLNRLNSDEEFKAQLESLIRDSQSNLAAHYEQHIENHGTVEKQINIQHNSGHITM